MVQCRGTRRWGTVVGVCLVPGGGIRTRRQAQARDCRDRSPAERGNRDEGCSYGQQRRVSVRLVVITVARGMGAGRRTGWAMRARGMVDDEWALFSKRQQRPTT